jgi:hypothetical protein
MTLLPLQNDDDDDESGGGSGDSDLAKHKNTTFFEPQF